MSRADEVRQDYITTMGNELGAQFYRLSNEYAWLHLKWNDYVALFGVSQSRVDILNASARGFFGLLEDSLWRDVILHLCTLTDDLEVGPERRRRQTLTVRRLPALVDPTIQEQVTHAVSAAVKKTKFARDWRNRYIAHRDLGLALNRGARLARASRKHVRKAIATIGTVLGVVELHYPKMHTSYEHVSHLGDAKTLLYVLREALDARQEQLERLKAGQLSPRELRPKPPI